MDLYLHADFPLNVNVECTLPGCSCGTNPLIWVSEKYKIVFFEVPKAGSTSLKNKLGLNMNQNDWKLAFIRHTILGNNPVLLPTGWGGSFDSDSPGRDLSATVKSGRDLSLGDARGMYEFKTFFGSTDLLLKKYRTYTSFINIREPIGRFLSIYNMLSPAGRRKQILAAGFDLDGESTIELFIKRYSKAKNHHLSQYYKTLHLAYMFNQTIVMDIKRADEGWSQLKKAMNSEGAAIEGDLPKKYVNKSASQKTINNITKEELDMIKHFYCADIFAFKAAFPDS